MIESPKRTAFEALPVAAILLFWNLLAGIAHFQGVGGPVSAAGVVMAALYVTVRGVSLAAEVIPPATADVRRSLYENARLAVPAGAWFVAAMAVGAVEAHIDEFTWVISSVETALAGAGLGVVGLYAVAAGHSALGGANAGSGGRTLTGDESSTRDEPATDGASGDD
ncbi:hypothetical protein [Halorussus sp. MSC15.2]|uniref:hypothetical protein n=1 Tax=Halorussus sp. MSC15.2 TaxID=2283638 RepID=UPI0013D7A9EC|nr:hypothetical protein [Halorussus sp. MSC15.2]NEU58243.1 hypothetical protein [Halorussus sp. MSC15.2]